MRIYVEVVQIYEIDIHLTDGASNRPGEWSDDERARVIDAVYEKADSSEPKTETWMRRVLLDDGSLGEAFS